MHKRLKRTYLSKELLNPNVRRMVELSGRVPLHKLCHVHILNQGEDGLMGFGRRNIGIRCDYLCLAQLCTWSIPFALGGSGHRQGRSDGWATNSSGGRGGSGISSSLCSGASGDIGLRGLSSRSRILLVLLVFGCFFALYALLYVVALLLQQWLLLFLLRLLKVDHLSQGCLSRHHDGVMTSRHDGS